ncbi:MAG TPA: hypothetical protein VFK76_02480 [Gaiellaceae bacterium]|nr:hypothetical protein [Gaiellaceae bacterium]
MSTSARPLAPIVVSSDGDTYIAERAARRHRARLGGYSAFGALWLLSALPLALYVDDGSGARLVVLYLAVAAIGLVGAIAVRGLYSWLRRRQVWSPWIFAFAALLATVGYIVQSAGNGGPMT